MASCHACNLAELNDIVAVDLIAKSIPVGQNGFVSTHHHWYPLAGAGLFHRPPAPAGEGVGRASSVRRHPKEVLHIPVLHPNQFTG